MGGRERGQGAGRRQDRLQTVDYGSARRVLESWSPDRGQHPGYSLDAGRHDHHMWVAEGHVSQRGIWGLRARRRERSPLPWQQRWREGQRPGPKSTGWGEAKSPPRVGSGWVPPLVTADH